MIVAESHRGRRLVGRLERGADLLPSLVAAGAANGVRAGELRATGLVEEVELRCAPKPPRRLAAQVTLVSLRGALDELDGRAHAAAYAVVARDGDNGIELVGGELVRARVVAVEFVIEAFDDLLIRRKHDAASGTTIIGEIVAARAETGTGARTETAARTATETAAAAQSTPEVSFEAPAKGRIVEAEQHRPSWEEVAAVSERQAILAEAAEADAELAEEPVQAGDVIEHPKFGRCDVERIEGDGEFAQVRLRNQRLVRLSLEVLDLRRDGTDERGRRRFRAVTPR